MTKLWYLSSNSTVRRLNFLFLSKDFGRRLRLKKNLYSCKETLEHKCLWWKKENMGYVKEILSDLVFYIIFPFILFFMVYYGFESSYVRMKFQEAPPEFIFTSVYAYRIIPNFLTVQMFDLTQFLVSQFSEKDLLLKNGSIYYHSVFLTNTVFFMLSCVILESI